ncbi:EmrB/QacA subfamily drug resistance transporter [Labedella gwakjiensis]|uniref:EmrB/QacA subfamily drug resistance transporter n=1 Tax=Labedella gwakjiensis TaxID=390269 RepID=A0A2P8GTB3_9MICO|nr:MDR family MFS transporter [Labedella gwakjiensis]PSL37201.1 EmrB/QacA subfamily drug resistance transporter [Labedella gwakjiensis]RUQ84538.1 MFS transporter [Labedella gwakjiensis]
MTSTDAQVGFRSDRGPILIALMLATGLIAIESTIIATAVPSIVDDLGGFAQFPWLFSIYLLAQAVSVPVYAKLADTIGRTPIILTGIGLFLLGSILCGFAWDMTSLIVFRAVQGLGAGAVLPVSVTIAGDIYSVRERAKAQGYLASVWAISSVVGPTLGGLFSQYLDWRWIFFVNIPLCLLAAFMLKRNHKEDIERTSHRVDIAGATVLTVALTLLILAVLEGGNAWAWNSWQSIGSFAVGALLLVVFGLIEQRAAEPVLPLAIFRRRLITTTSLISLGVGAILVGLTSFVPTFLEVSADATPLIGGLAVAALTLGWPIAASQSGKIYLRIGFRPTALIGLGIAVVGALMLWSTAGTPNAWLAAAACFVVGLGLGLVATPTLIAAQSSVDWEERGVVTGTNLFMRSIGSAVGVAIFGAIANSIIARTGGEESASAVQTGSSAVFLAVVIAAVATIAAGIVMPKVKAPQA